MVSCPALDELGSPLDGVRQPRKVGTHRGAVVLSCLVARRGEVQTHDVGSRCSHGQRHCFTKPSRSRLFLPSKYTLGLILDDHELEHWSKGT
jgi:hypothetical protein